MIALFFSLASSFSFASMNEVTIMLDGNRIHLSTPPLITDYEIFLSMKDIAEAFGAKVSWNSKASTLTAKKEGLTVILKVSESILLINGEKVYTWWKIYKDKTMVPLNTSIKAFDCIAGWDSKTNIVWIWSPLLLRENQVYHIDLNGDGKEESVVTRFQSEDIVLTNNNKSMKIPMI